MPERFDPYHQWLGIPLREQPPDNYRLLGIVRFEESPQVIDAAADRQMTYLKRFQSGEHAPVAARLMNEIARARVCLLKPVTKAEYDRQLKAAANQTARPAVDPADKSPVRIKVVPRTVSASSIMMGVSAAIICVGLALMWRFLGGAHRSEIHTSTSPTQSAHSPPSATHAGSTIPAVSSDQQKQTNQSSRPGKPVVRGWDTPGDLKPVDQPHDVSKSGTGVSESGAKVQPATDLDTKPSAPPPTPAQQVAQADEGKEPADGQEGEQSEQDLSAQKTALLASLKNATTDQEAQELFERCRKLANELDAAAQYRDAQEVFEGAASHVKKPQVKRWKDRAIWFARQTKARADAYDATATARTKLEMEPDHPKSNLTLGLFVCFHLQDWPRGLPMLVKSKDRFWTPLAESELQPPEDLKKQLDLADDWLEAIKKGPEPIPSVSRTKADAVLQAAWKSIPESQRRQQAAQVDQRIVKLFGKSLFVTNGNGNGVALPNSERWNPVEDMTIEFWVSTQTEKGALLSKFGTDQDSSLVVHLDNGKPQLSLKQKGGEGGSGGGNAVNDGAWHHFALVKDGATARLYVDGGLVNEKKLEMPVLSAAPWRVGACRDKNPTAGRFAGVRISNVVRYTEPFIPGKACVKDPDTVFANW